MTDVYEVYRQACIKACEECSNYGRIMGIGCCMANMDYPERCCLNKVRNDFINRKEQGNE
jgi:hypothetical protein